MLYPGLLYAVVGVLCDDSTTDVKPSAATEANLAGQHMVRQGKMRQLKVAK